MTQCLTAVMLVASLLFVAGEVLVFHDDRLKLVLSAATFIAAAYAAQALVFVYSDSSTRHRNSSATAKTVGWVIAHLGTAFAFAVYAVGVGLQVGDGGHEGRRHYGQDLRTGGAIIGLLNALYLAALSYGQTVPQQHLCPGNFFFLAHVFGSAGFFAIFLAEYTHSAGKQHDSCGIACEGSRELGYTFVFMSALMYSLFAVVMHDTVCVEDGVEGGNAAIAREIFCNCIDSLRATCGLKSGIADYKTAESDEESGALAVADAAAEGEAEAEAEAYGDPAVMDEVLAALPPEPQPVAEEIKDSGDDDARSTASGDGPVLDTDVFIVGSGPSGLALANELGLRGNRVVIIDMRPQATADSRFFNLACATVEGMKRIGVLPAILAKSIPQSFGHGSIAATGMTHPDRRIIGNTQGPSRDVQVQLGKRLSQTAASRTVTSRWAEQPAQRCMQGVQEVVLRDKAMEYPSVHVMYGWKLLQFYDDNECVYAKIQSVADGEPLASSLQIN